MRSLALGVAILCLPACVEELPSLDAGAPDGAESQCVTLPEVVSFGEIANGVPVERTLSFTNEMEHHVLLVTATRPDEPFSSNLNGPSALLPGRSFSLKIGFRPTDALLRIGHLLFVGGEGCPVQDVRLEGLGEGELEATPDVVDFGMIPLGELASRPLHLRNSRRVPMEIEFAGSTSVRPPNVVVPAGGALDVPLEITPQLEVNFFGVLEVRGHRVLDGVTEGRISDQINVRVLGQPGVPIISVSTTDIHIEHLPIDAVLLRTIVVANNGQQPTSLSLVTVVPLDGGAGFLNSISFDGFSNFVRPGQSTMIRVAFQGTQLGPFSLTAFVQSQDPVTPSTAVNLWANVEDFTPCSPLAVSPQMVQWTTPAYPVRATFTFENQNPWPCLIDAIQLTEPGWVFEEAAPQQLIVPANDTGTRTVLIDSPGMGELWWSQWNRNANPSGFYAPITVGF